jgi:hypothetical protein
MRIDLKILSLTLSLVFLSAYAHAAKTDRIGVIGAANDHITVTAEDKTERQVKLGDSIFYKETVSADATGNAQLLFVDKSALTVGPNSSVVIDEFVYNPATSSGNMVMRGTKGTFRFIGGALSKQNEVKLKTPVGTIGIRGGIAIVKIDANTGATNATFVYGDKLTFQNLAGDIKTITDKGVGLAVATGTSIPKEFDVTVAQMASQVKELAGKPGTNAGAGVVPTEKDVGQGLKAGDGTGTGTTSPDGDKKNPDGANKDGGVNKDGAANKDGKTDKQGPNGGPNNGGNNNGGGNGGTNNNGANNGGTNNGANNNNPAAPGAARTAAITDGGHYTNDGGYVDGKGKYHTPAELAQRVAAQPSGGDMNNGGANGGYATAGGPNGGAYPAGGTAAGGAYNGGYAGGGYAGGAAGAPAAGGAYYGGGATAPVGGTYNGGYVGGTYAGGTAGTYAAPAGGAYNGGYVAPTAGGYGTTAYNTYTAPTYYGGAAGTYNTYTAPTYYGGAAGTYNTYTAPTYYGGAVGTYNTYTAPVYSGYYDPMMGGGTYYGGTYYGGTTGYIAPVGGYIDPAITTATTAATTNYYNAAAQIDTMAVDIRNQAYNRVINNGGTATAAYAAGVAAETYFRNLIANGTEISAAFTAGNVYINTNYPVVSGGGTFPMPPKPTIVHQANYDNALAQGTAAYVAAKTNGYSDAVAVSQGNIAYNTALTNYEQASENQLFNNNTSGKTYYSSANEALAVTTPIVSPKLANQFSGAQGLALETSMDNAACTNCSYLDWDVWVHVQPNNSATVSNEIYGQIVPYVYGTITPPANIPGTVGTPINATYTGSSVLSNGGTPFVGTVTADITLRGGSNASLTGFTFNIPQGATLASGAVNVDIGTTSTFNGLSVAGGGFSGSASGALFGPAAQNLGGNMTYGSGASETGLGVGVYKAGR